MGNRNTRIQQRGHRIATLSTDAPQPVSATNEALVGLDDAISDLHSDIGMLERRAAGIVVQERMVVLVEPAGAKVAATSESKAPPDRSVIRDKIDQAVTAILDARAKIARLTSALDV